MVGVTPPQRYKHLKGHIYFCILSILHKLGPLE